jgi:hypothetical protein
MPWPLKSLQLEMENRKLGIEIKTAFPTTVATKTRSNEELHAQNPRAMSRRPDRLQLGIEN